MVAKTNYVGALMAAAGTLAAVGLLVLMLVVSVQPAEGTFPGKNGRIAFAGVTKKAIGIYTIKPGGGGRFQVTNSKREAGDPSYSPNGKRIAYAGYPEKDWEIYTNTVGGGGKVKVTDNTTDDTDPSWGSRP